MVKFIVINMFKETFLKYILISSYSKFTMFLESCQEKSLILF